MRIMHPAGPTNAIPLNLYPGDEWQTYPLRAGAPYADPLVALGPHAHPPYHRLLTHPVLAGTFASSPYAPNGLPGSLFTVFLRRSTADRLLEAQRLLPADLRLVVFDGYRPYDTKKALYDHYFTTLQRVADRAGHRLTTDEVDAETVKYVKRPSHDPSAPAPHNTGGAVDLAVCSLGDAAARVVDIEHLVEAASVDDRDVEAMQTERFLLVKNSVQMLDYAAPYDDGGPAASLTYLEHQLAVGELSSDQVLGLHNRRQLYALMTAVGMGHYVYEWWHFNTPETQLGALCLGLPHGTFGPMELDAAQRELERTARARWAHLVEADPGVRGTTMQPAARISPPADLFGAPT